MVAMLFSNFDFVINFALQKQFQKAVDLVGEELLNRICFYRDSWLPARSLVEAAVINRKEVSLLPVQEEKVSVFGPSGQSGRSLSEFPEHLVARSISTCVMHISQVEISAKRGGERHCESE